jgi:hypothetical protein
MAIKFSPDFYVFTKKLSVLAATDAFFHRYFLSPIAALQSNHGLMDSNSKTQLCLLSDRLCDSLLLLLDASLFDSPVQFLNSAPLLVDLDVERGLYEQLESASVILNQPGDDEGGTRLTFLIASIEQTGW